MIAQNATRQMLFAVTPPGEIVCVEVVFVLTNQKLIERHQNTLFTQETPAQRLFHRDVASNVRV
jgi:hypothetical protein